MSVGRLQLLFPSWHFLRLPKSICITGHVLYIRVRRARAAGPLLSAADHEGQQTQRVSLQPPEKPHKKLEVRMDSSAKTFLLQETGLVVQSSRLIRAWGSWKNRDPYGSSQPQGTRHTGIFVSYELGCFFPPSFDYEDLLFFLPLAKQERNYF